MCAQACEATWTTDPDQAPANKGEGREGGREGKREEEEEEKKERV